MIRATPVASNLVLAKLVNAQIVLMDEL